MAEAQPISPFAASTVEYMKNNKHLAGVYSAKVGVSAAAVLGSIANEYDTRYNSELYAKSTGKLGQAFGDFLGSNNFGAMIFTDSQSKYSHEQILENYNAIKAGNPNPVPAYTPGFLDTVTFKYLNPALVDVGPGNIQIKTAIEIVEKAYNAKMSGGNDDLGLAKYHGHYDTLVTDLLNFTKPETSFAIAAAVAKEAVQYLSNKNPAAWNKLTVEEKDAMIVVYYKMGESKIDEKINEGTAKASSEGKEYEYSPQKSDGGEQHLKNIGTYRTLDYSKPAYVKCFSADTMIAMADGSEKAISDIRVGDVVLAFGGIGSSVDGGLTGRKVTNVFRNTTDQWLLVKAFDQDNKIVSELTVTPGHLFFDGNESFRKIEDIIAAQGNIVTSQGNLLRVEGKRLNCTKENFELYENINVRSNESGNLDGDKGQYNWVTYNFEVEDLHTYIANGVRVHNDSVLDYVPDQSIITKVVVSSDGYVREAEYIRLKDGVKVYVTGADLDGNPNTTERLSEKLTIPPSANGTDDAIIEQVREFDPKTGAEISRKISDINYTGVSLEQYGTVLGSYLGTAIAGDNAVGQLAAGTLLSTLLGNLGEFIQAGTNLSLLEGSYFDGQLQTTDPFGDALNVTLKDFGKDLGNAVKGQVAGMISSILVAELAQALDLDGVPATAFTTTGQAITQQFLDNLTDVVLEKPGADLLKGFNNPEQLFANVGNAFGNLIASHLAGEIVTARSKEAALFGSAAGAILSLAMTSIPVIGPFIGTFLGNTLGTMIGNALFDNDDVAYYRLSLDPLNRKIVASFYEQRDDGKLETAKGMADQAANYINEFVAAINARIDFDSDFNGAVLGYFVDHYNAKKAYSWGLTEHPVLNGEGASVAIAAAESWSFKTLDLIIPDPIVRRAYYASRDDGVTQLGLDIKVAQDYRKYLENTSVITGLINADPDSSFAAGWAITLLRARELGLNRGSADDFKGGFYLNLSENAAVQGARGMGGGFAPERLAWTPDLDAGDVLSGSMKTGDLLLRSADGLSTVRVDNVFGPGAVVTRVGDNTTAAVDGSAINSPDASVIYIRAGDGAKTVKGSASQGSIIVGGVGAQTLIGGKGNDWLRAGKDNKELLGGAGDDLLVGGPGAPILDGGSGRNTYYLGEGNASVRVSALDVKGADTIVATLAGAFNATNGITVTAKGGVSGQAVTNAATTFGRYGADLIIGTRTGNAADGAGKLVVENFFLTLSSVDSITFADGTKLSNIDIWNRALGRVNVDETVWNQVDASTTRSVIDTDDTFGTIYSQQSTKTKDGKSLFDVGIYDAGEMYTVAYDPYEEHDWTQWVSEYAANGSLGTDRITLDAKNADGTAIVITRGGGGAVAGSVGDDVLRSAASGSLLVGDRGNDTLIGAAGADTLYGGTGNDRYVIGAGDRVVEFAGQGTDVIESTISYVLAAGHSIEELRLADSTGTAALNLTGNELDNILVGNAGANVLDGGNGGADKIDGRDGIDTVSYASSARGVTIDIRAKLTWDGVKNDTLASIENAIGSALDDTLAGDGYANVLDGGAGADKINGAGGIDTVSYATASRKVSVDLSKGIAWDGANDTLTAIENATGSAFDDTLVGDAGANVLDGGAGADILNGGDGIDTVSYASAKRQVSVDLSKNTAWDGASDTITAIENATGSVFNDTLVGDAGTNVLDGGDGDDILKGGLGNDVYVVDSASDTVTEVAGEGTDEVRTDLSSYTLAAETEILRYTGTAAFVGSGNGLANTLYGGVGADSLNGGAGNDVMRGGTGNDTYYADNAGDQVFEATGQGYDTVVSQNSFTLAAGQAIEVLRLTATNVGRSLAGNEFDNVITGNAGDNGLWGNAGNDTIDGGDGGADAIDGGDGRDTVSYVSSSRKVTIALNDKLTWDGEKNDTLVSIENAIGSAFDDVLGGDANANVLNGGAGADTMRGGLGDDTYAVDNAGDQVLEKAGEGNDVIVASVSYGIATGQEIERIQLASATGTQALNLYGNELNNVLWGNAGNNTLDGRAGADQMDGNLGNDTYGVDNVGDTVIEAANEGTDTIIAGNTNYTLAAGVSVEVMRFANSVTGDFDLTGNELNNDITGTAGNNILIGNAGNDILRGREGDDVYSVDSAGDQVIEGTGQGNDAVIALTSYKLQAGQEIETLQLATATAGASLNLEGNEFANSLSGNSGANRLNGGGGSDTLWGKGGADSFVFNTALGSGNLDTIVDFVSGEDRIVLDNSVMAVLPTGALAASAFKNLSQGAADADDRIIYNQAKGDLWYDADGSGSVAGVRIAVLENKGALTYQDILVV